MTNCKRTMEFAKKMNCKMPKSLLDMFVGLDSDPQTRKLVATTIVYEQCRKLLDGEVKDFHFYTLNQSRSLICNMSYFGIRTLKDEN